MAVKAEILYYKLSYESVWWFI